MRLTWIIQWPRDGKVMRETHVQNTIKNRKLDNTSVEYSPLQGYARNTIKNKNKGLAREEGEEGEE